MTLEILLPVLVQGALTFGLLLATGLSRFRAISSGQTRVKDIALGQKAWPEQPTKFANAFANQFELPVLFYVIVAMLVVTMQTTIADVVLAWAFVATRLVHAAIHVSTNQVIHRFYAFVSGAGILMAMWGYWAIRLIGEGKL